MKDSRAWRLLVCLLSILFAVPALAQQDYVNRYDVFTGFAYLTTPTLNLNQRGFNGSAGVNVNRWLALGGDFTIVTGSTSIAAADTRLGPLLAPFTPPGVSISAPFDAKTISFAAGPQFNLRRWKPVTLFVRPGFGVYHESVSLALPAIVTLLVPTLTASMSDTTYFYGAGGGVDINASRHVGLRLSADWARTHLFPDLLNQQNNIRMSVGPTFRWGELP